jgi:hypothetical protein
MDHTLEQRTSETLTMAEIIDMMSAATRNLLRALLEALRGNASRSRDFLATAEKTSKDEQELCYTFHAESMILSYLGDAHMAVAKDTKCLGLCSRLDLKGLQFDALSHLSLLYRALGLKDLERSYADEAGRGAYGKAETHE